MNSGRTECTFLWCIENCSCYVCNKGRVLSSPAFTFDGLEGTTWHLVLDPKGLRDSAHENNISLFLRRENKDAGPERFMVSFEISLLAADGSVCQSRNSKYEFGRYELKGFHHFLEKDEICLRRKDEYLPNDTLSVSCKMWTGEGQVQNTERISARTRVHVEQISYLHVVERFSALQPNIKTTTEVLFPFSRKSISNSLYRTDEGKIIIEIAPSDATNVLLKCKFSLLMKGGKIKDCGGIDYAFNAESKSNYKLSLSLPKEITFCKKSEYLPNDKFCLLYKCTFSTGWYFHTIEESRKESTLKPGSNNANNRNVIKDAEKISEYCSVWDDMAEEISEYCSESDDMAEEISEYCNVSDDMGEKRSEYCSISNDMKAMYINQQLMDMVIKTKTKSFPTHKVILCIRSPVFEAMLASGLEENKTSCIEVDDLDDDTVEQLLLFFYTDRLENLEWNSTMQLYYAADKYQIDGLQAICSSFLVENLSTSNAGVLLLLSDMHNDSNLKTIVEDFILKHDEQIFSSTEWENLKEINPQLVIETMCLKYRKKK